MNTRRIRGEAPLDSSPDPRKAGHYLGRLRQEAPEAFESVRRSTAAIREAISVFSYSDFLSEAVLKNPQWILEGANSGGYDRVLTAEEYERRLASFLGSAAGVPA